MNKSYNPAPQPSTSKSHTATTTDSNQTDTDTGQTANGKRQKHKRAQAERNGVRDLELLGDFLVVLDDAAELAHVEVLEKVALEEALVAERALRPLDARLAAHPRHHHVLRRLGPDVVREVVQLHAADQEVRVGSDERRLGARRDGGVDRERGRGPDDVEDEVLVAHVLRLVLVLDVPRRQHARRKHAAPQLPEGAVRVEVQQQHLPSHRRGQTMP
eukprot:1873677-Rhodomonas_salina.2